MDNQTAIACKLENQIHVIDRKITIKETIKDIVLTKVMQYMVIYLLLKNIIIFYLLFRK